MSDVISNLKYRNEMPDGLEIQRTTNELLQSEFILSCTLRNIKFEIT